MIVLALQIAFILACLFWACTWLVQLGIPVISLLAKIVLVVLFTVFGSLVWIGWWIVNPKSASASLRQHEAQKRAMKEMGPSD